MRRDSSQWIMVVFIIVTALLTSLTVCATMVKKTVMAYSLPVSSFTFSPTTPTPYDIITFDASGSYAPDGYIVQYTWDFGDGSVITTINPTATHSYPVDGTYTVELTVIDNDLLSDSSSAIVQVSSLVFFRAVFMGTLIPMANVQVTAYRYNGTAWVVAPVGSNVLEIRYDNMTQPNLASTDEQKYRNPGFTTSILCENASNIGFDVHQSDWNVFFKFQWGPYVAYWPNETTKVYSFNNGAVETHDYNEGHKAYWDAAAGTYAIKVSHIRMNGVNPVGNHPIIVGILCPPTQQCYLTARTDPLGITTIPGEGWYNKDTNATIMAPSQVVVSSTSQYRFGYWDVDGTSHGAGVNPIEVQMNTNHTATAHFVLQYSITIGQTGVGSDFSGIIVSVDGNGYSRSSLPVSFWWDTSSMHTFSFGSPLSVGIGIQYNWVNTTGLSTLQSDTLTITASGSVVGNYIVENKCQITFDQTGISSDYTGNVLTVDGADYQVIDLPVSFWWDSGSVHSYSYSSPLLVGVNMKQYVWTGTSGLSTTQSDSIIVTNSGSITGSYVTKCYLTVTSNPSGITGQIGEGWYDAGANATVSTQAFIDISPDSSRYRFNGWTTPDMPEISNPLVSPTSVLIDKPKTVTANYVVQYKITFDQSGTSPDFPGTIITVDGVNYAFSYLPTSFWYDTSSVHTFAYQSPLIVTPNAKTYVWTSTTGLSVFQSETITVSSSGSITGTYKTQYYLAVTSPYGSPSPASGWYDSGTTIPASINSPVPGPTGTRYVCTGWSGTGSVPASGSDAATTFQINAPSTLLWIWKTQYYLTVAVDPAALVTIPGEGWYDASATVILNAPQVTNCTFVNWDVDGISGGDGVNPITTTMSTFHTATAHYHQISVETLTASISPRALTMTLGPPVNFSSTVQGGKLPYSYQWYLDGQPVSGATTSTWTFTPSTGGIYYVYLRVIDADHTIAQSETARIDVISNPVGGYSISLDKQLSVTAIATYSALVGLFGSVLSFTRRKRK